MNHKTFLFFIFYFLFGIAKSWSIPNTDIVTPFPNGIQLYGTRDDKKFPFSRSLASSGDYVRQICNNKSLTYDLSKIIYTPIATFAGYGQAGLIFRESGAPGLSTVPSLMSQLFNADIGPNQYVSMPIEPKVVYRGGMSDDWRKGVYGFRVTTGVRVYRSSGSIENGSVIPRQPLYMYTCYDMNGVARETSTILLDNVPLTINVVGCTPESKSTAISMTGVPVANIENAASSTLIGTQQQTFSIKCDPSVSIYYSVVDLNDPTNISTTSTLTPDSTAAGIGYTITSSDGTRLQFGPDGSAVGIPGQTKYFLGKATEENGFLFSHQLGFSYVRKPGEAVKTGSAKSLIGITYSYQ